MVNSLEAVGQMQLFSELKIQPKWCCLFAAISESWFCQKGKGVFDERGNKEGLGLFGGAHSMINVGGRR
jgi:hypothetical protein